MSTDTPRTDAAEAKARAFYNEQREIDWPPFDYNSAFDFARTLERELAKIKSYRAEDKRAFDAVCAERDQLRSDLNDAKDQLDTCMLAKNKLVQDRERLAKAAEDVLRSYIIGKRVEAGHPCPENLAICVALRAAIDAAGEATP